MPNQLERLTKELEGIWDVRKQPWKFILSELSDRSAGELTAKDRTIRQQQNLIEKYEAEREKQLHSLSQNGGGSSLDGGDMPGTVTAGDSTSASDRNQSAETISTATQTERLRPVSFGGQEGLGSRSEKPKNGLRTPTAVGLPSNTTSTTPPHHNTINGPTTPKSKTQISSVYTQLSSVRHSIAGTSAPTTPTAATTTPNGPTALRRTSLGSSHNNLSAFGLHATNDRSPGAGAASPSNKPVRTTHIGTLPSPTARSLANGERTALPNGTKPTKTIPNRTASAATAINGAGVTKLNGLNGTTTKRTGIIRPPSSFGSSNSLAAVEQQLKSKSAAPLVVAGGKLLTPAATGEPDSGTNGHREMESCNTPASDPKDTAPVGTLAGNLKLPGGCSDGTSLGSATSNTANGIVGH
uniref:Uncharacterized protein n=1 Tax=Anopheles culicifacies TaxID=139723 RepID=A0A182MJG7_9DIPT